MKRQILMVLLINLMAAGGDMTRAASDTGPLRLIQTIPLPGVEGRIDHLAVDLAGRRLFVAALGNNTVEVVDLKKGERVQSLAGFKEPQGLAYLPDTKTIAEANGGDCLEKLLDCTALKPTKMVAFRDGAHNVRHYANR